MKERPILFSAPMVRAILSGVKTQTRRVVKPLPEFCGGQGEQLDVRCWGWMNEDRDGPNFLSVADSRCPYGSPGDRLWVRETFSTDAVSMYPCPRAWYRATDFNDRSDLNDWHVCPKESRGRYADCLACWEEREGRKFKWRPSIFMRREFSRITLEIVSVRVERLNEISGVDAWREGCPYHPKAEPTPDDVKAWYRELWESLNGDGSWALNPWVWVVEFKRL